MLCRTVHQQLLSPFSADRFFLYAGLVDLLPKAADIATSPLKLLFTARRTGPLDGLISPKTGSASTG